MAGLALYIVVFIALSGLMAMMDAAVLSVSRGEVEEMVLKKKWGAIALRAIQERLTRAVVIIVLITNTINILGPILAGKKAIDFKEECGRLIDEIVLPKLRTYVQEHDPSDPWYCWAVEKLLECGEGTQHTREDRLRLLPTKWMRN